MAAVEKTEKKSKKEKRRSEDTGVSKHKKDKREKKDKKEKLAAALEAQLEEDAAAATKRTKVDEVLNVKAQDESLQHIVVPFAVPIADEKGMKKVYKTVRKAAKNGSLKRGVKEVVKALRKSPPSAPGYTAFPGVVIIAGDISPLDVISHLPVLCEDHNVPFIFVTSRAELGASARTKRPTSVVMVMEKPWGPAAAKKKKEQEKANKEKDDEDEGEAYAESYASLVKLVQKELSKQAFWAKGEC
ncbi:hypothetical protein CDD82_7620 [Ophiocordyceps australis]|uniref:Ribosomal protein eL8/eL30/eS12/Gadd45 domain-containing protein n=1 Tax=Ophiocordyceps australis TaxID=1399860 RepID=A0A2C5YJG2_9HYPO|nr:hypothetical protein CDD82_7620 [Ophiocordyceps australis]